jgi:hypothetical protein
MRAARSLVLDVSPLRESTAYRALWIGQIVSLIGSHMRIVALSFLVFQITESTLAVGLIGLVEIVPLIAFSMIGGTVADRVDRRKVMACAQVALMGASVALAIVALMDRPPLPAIYALAALSSAFLALDMPARSSLVPDLVGTELIPSALALRQVVFQVTQIVGPLLAGLLIAGLNGRVAPVFVVDALSFTAALVALRWVPSIRAHGPTDESALQSIRAGLRYAIKTPLILSILVIDLVAMIFGMPRAAFPELASTTFGSGASVLGLLYAAPSAGALLGALTTGWVRNVKRHGLAVIVSVSIWGLAIALAGLFVSNLAITLAFLAIAGAADVVSAVFRGTILNVNTPGHLLGRVNAVNLMIVTGGPRLGDVEAGIAANLVGAPESIVFGGIACLVGTGLLASTNRSLRDYRSR